MSATVYAYNRTGHLLGEYDGAGNLIQETVWLGDIPVATIRPSGFSIAIYYVVTDQLGTPREVIGPSDNTQMWTWFTGSFGAEAPNTNPQGLADLWGGGPLSISATRLYAIHWKARAITAQPAIGETQEQLVVGDRH